MTDIPVLDKIITNIINPFIAFLLVLALIYFMYGVYRFIADNGSDTGRTTGKRHMLWGVVGLAIMISVYGLIDLIMNTVKGISN